MEESENRSKIECNENRKETNMVGTRDTCVGEKKNTNKFVVGKTCRPETAGKMMRGWEDNIQIALKNNETLKGIHLAQDKNR
jgi:hypothetical protein